MIGNIFAILNTSKEKERGNKMKKKIIVAILTAAMIITTLAACKKAEPPVAAPTTAARSGEAELPAEAALQGDIVFATMSTGALGDIQAEMIADFMKENPDVKVEIQVNTTDYESLMKAKMAANDMPDVFMTHGWSLIRYSEYLLPLTGEPWAETMADTLKASMCDEDGNFYALSTTVDLTGVLVQMDILRELGMEMPVTVDDFLECCEAAKNAGYDAVFMAGKDTRSPAYVLDLMAPSFLLNNDDGTNASALANGSFDWDLWIPVVDFLQTLKDNGYMNIDCATADTIFQAEKLVNKEALFIFQRNSVLSQCWEINPEANVGFIPFPVQSAEDSPYLAGGEGVAFGIWKDGKHLDIARALLEFLARPENVEKMCYAEGAPSGQKNVEVSLGKIDPWVEQWSDVKALPWFDRVYLPSGMWAILRDTGSAIIAGEATPEEATAIMKENYLKLFSQQ